MTGRRLSESEIIAIVREMTPADEPGVMVPVGDDAAQFHFSGGDVLLSTDSMYEGVHFDLDSCTLSDVGWKAMVAGVSDIGAMGGQPLCALLSVAFGEAPLRSEVVSLMDGVLEMLASCHCALVGGDVSRSVSGLSLTATVAGTPPPTGPVRRGGAARGDILGVTGTVGDSAAGLLILERGSDALRGGYPDLVEAHLRPRPRVLAGGILAAAGVSAMEDVSDGLAVDLSHICEESGLGCEIEEGLVPVSAEAVALGRELGVDPMDWALAGGEDYELVFTAPPGRFEKATRILGDHGIVAARVGVMKASEAGRVAIQSDGTRRELKGMGYEHFA